jgi:hypothetical protein
MMKKLLLLILFLIFAINLAGCATIDEKQTQVNAAKEKKLALEDRWGIEIMDIRTTAGGYMLHFRYKIIDPEKAASLVSLQVKPYVIDLATNTKLSVPQLPKVGSLRQRSRDAKVNRTYFVMFSNPGQLIKAGGKVTVVIGDFIAENLAVE